MPIILTVILQATHYFDDNVLSRNKTTHERIFSLHLFRRWDAKMSVQKGFLEDIE